MATNRAYEIALDNPAPTIMMPSNLDPDALTAEMTTVFEHLWNSFTSEAV